MTKIAKNCGTWSDIEDVILPEWHLSLSLFVKRLSISEAVFCTQFGSVICDRKFL